MDIKVIDAERQERPFSWAEAKYGVKVQRADVAEGEPCFRLWKLVERVGPAGIYPEVWWKDPQTYTGILVAFSWPDAPSPPEGGDLPPTEVYPHDWLDRFVYGRTDADGVVAFGIGEGGYHGEGEGGPHSVWVHHPEFPSDLCDRLGMLAGTFHSALSPVFLLTENGNGGETPVAEEKFMVLGEPEWQENGAGNVLVIELAEGSERNFSDTRLDVRVNFEEPPVPSAEGQWAYEYPEPFTPAEGMESYAVEIPYKPAKLESWRNFWWRIRDPHGAPLSDWHTGRWYTDEPGAFIWRVTWAAEEEPGPGPGPSPGPGPGDNLAALFMEMSQRLGEMAEICYRISQLFGSLK